MDAEMHTDAARDAAAINDEELDELVAALAGASRKRRQDASHEIALIASVDAHPLLAHVDDLVDALERPEAQTRWEVLSTLSELALIDADAVEGAYEGAEAALFDEGSAILRLAAFRFLVRLGESSPERSDKVWQIMDEAIQCFHGDPEYRDMLGALDEFARGSLSDQTREALLARVGFDADNRRGYIKIMSTETVAVAKGERA